MWQIPFFLVCICKVMQPHKEFATRTLLMQMPGKMVKIILDIFLVLGFSAPGFDNRVSHSGWCITRDDGDISGRCCQFSLSRPVLPVPGFSTRGFPDSTVDWSLQLQKFGNYCSSPRKYVQCTYVQCTCTCKSHTYVSWSNQEIDTI